jgi:hypothetical protein
LRVWLRTRGIPWLVFYVFTSGLDAAGDALKVFLAKLNVASLDEIIGFADAGFLLGRRGLLADESFSACCLLNGSFFALPRTAKSIPRCATL